MTYQQALQKAQKVCRAWRLRAVAGSGGGLEVAWDPLTHRRSGAFLAWRQAQRIGMELERRPKYEFMQYQ